MLVQKTKTGPIQWRGEEIDGVQHQQNIEQLWTDEELSRVGLFRVKDEKIPDDMIVVDWKLEDRGSEVVRLPVLEEAPKPEPSLEDRVAALESKV